MQRLTSIILSIFSFLSLQAEQLPKQPYMAAFATAKQPSLATQQPSMAASATAQQPSLAAAHKAAEKARKKEVKKQLSQAKAWLKQGSNLQKVESSMNQLLEDSANQRDERLHLALYESLVKQYQQGNEKLFLKQKYDTAALFSTARKMFEALERFDSIDALPNEKGRIAPRYRKEHAAQLVQLHRNLYTGAIYFVNHQNYDEASKCIETFLAAPQWPLFSSAKLSTDQRIQKHAAYLALLSNYKRNDMFGALKHKDEAQKFSPRLESTFQYLCDIYLQMKDSAMYISTLHQGVDSFPKSAFFFPRLVDDYCDKGQYTEALSLTDRIIEADTTNLLLHLTRQTILLNLTRYDECIADGKEIISRNDSLPEAYYNIALAYYNKALEMNSNTALRPRDRVRQVNELYRKCRPYMEKYRALAPEQKKRWRPVLYTIYLNLNLGKEFAEIEKI